MKNLQPVNSLSIPRLLQLCKLTLFKNKRQWLTGMLAASGLIIVLWLLPLMISSFAAGTIRGPMEYTLAMFIFVLWGLLVTSDIFQELHSPSTAFQSFTLPATSSEKFLAAWMITYPLLFLIFSAALIVISLIVSLSYALLNSGFSFETIYSPFSNDSIELAGRYFYYNSLFLLGAVLFKKNNFLKTILAIITIVISFIFLSALTMFIISAGSGVDHLSFQLDDPQIMNTISTIFKVVVSFSCLLLTYILLKKRQVV